MTKSLDSHLEAALRQRDGWGIAQTRNLLEECRKQIADSQIDWEEGDENWGRLVKDREVKLLVSALIPLVVVLSSHSAALQNVAGNCLVIPIESFSSEIFSVSKQLIERIVEREVSSNVNYKQMSIDELWWATV